MDNHDAIGSVAENAVDYLWQSGRRLEDRIKVSRAYGEEKRLEKLKETGYHFKRATGQLKDFKVTFRGLSMNDM